MNSKTAKRLRKAADFHPQHDERKYQPMEVLVDYVKEVKTVGEDGVEKIEKIEDTKFEKIPGTQVNVGGTPRERYQRMKKQVYAGELIV